MSLALCFCFLLKALLTLLLHLSSKSRLPVPLSLLCTSLTVCFLARCLRLTVGLCLRFCLRLSLALCFCRGARCLFRTGALLSLHLRGDRLLASCLVTGLLFCYGPCFLGGAVSALLGHLALKKSLTVGLCLRSRVPRCYVLGRFCAVLLAVPRERAAGALGRARCGKSLVESFLAVGPTVIAAAAYNVVNRRRTAPALAGDLTVVVVHGLAVVADGVTLGFELGAAVFELACGKRVVIRPAIPAAAAAAAAAVVSAIFQGNSRPKTPALRKRCHFGLSRR